MQTRTHTLSHNTNVNFFVIRTTLLFCDFLSGPNYLYDSFVILIYLVSTSSLLNIYTIFRHADEPSII